MARKTIRVTMPTSRPDEFSKLLNVINEQHKKLGKDSPLDGDADVDMSVYDTQLKEGDELRKKSEALRKQSEDIMMQARTKYGTTKGQTVNTLGTLYYKADVIKRKLLAKYKGNEESLSNFGFNVVVGQAKSPVKKKS